RISGIELSHAVAKMPLLAGSSADLGDVGCWPANHLSERQVRCRTRARDRKNNKWARLLAAGLRRFEYFHHTTPDLEAPGPRRGAYPGPGTPFFWASCKL